MAQNQEASPHSVGDLLAYSELRKALVRNEIGQEGRPTYHLMRAFVRDLNPVRYDAAFRILESDDY